MPATAQPPARASSPGLAGSPHYTAAVIYVSHFREVRVPAPGSASSPRAGRRTPCAPSRSARVLLLCCSSAGGAGTAAGAVASWCSHAGLQPQRGEDLQSQLRQVPSRGESVHVPHSGAPGGTPRPPAAALLGPGLGPGLAGPLLPPIRGGPGASGCELGVSSALVNKGATVTASEPGPGGDQGRRALLEFL